MAFKLDKADSARRAALIEELTTVWGTVEDAVATYNAGLAALKGPLEAAFDAYNEVLQEARGFAEDIATAAEEEIDNKSDKWREGERGEAAIAYKDAWGEVAQMDDLSVEFPDDIAVDDPDHISSLDGAPEEASS